MPQTRLIDLELLSLRTLTRVVCAEEERTDFKRVRHLWEVDIGQTVSSASFVDEFFEGMVHGYSGQYRAPLLSPLEHKLKLCASRSSYSAFIERNSSIFAASTIATYFPVLSN